MRPKTQEDVLHLRQERSDQGGILFLTHGLLRWLRDRAALLVCLAIVPWAAVAPARGIGINGVSVKDGRAGSVAAERLGIHIAGEISIANCAPYVQVSDSITRIVPWGNLFAKGRPANSAAISSMRCYKSRWASRSGRWSAQGLRIRRPEICCSELVWTRWAGDQEIPIDGDSRRFCGVLPVVLNAYLNPHIILPLRVVSASPHPMDVWSSNGQLGHSLLQTEALLGRLGEILSGPSISSSRTRLGVSRSDQVFRLPSRSVHFEPLQTSPASDNKSEEGHELIGKIESAPTMPVSHKERWPLLIAYVILLFVGMLCIGPLSYFERTNGRVGLFIFLLGWLLLVLAAFAIHASATTRIGNLRR